MRFWLKKNLTNFGGASNRVSIQPIQPVQSIQPTNGENDSLSSNPRPLKLLILI